MDVFLETPWIWRPFSPHPRFIPSSVFYPFIRLFASVIRICPTNLLGFPVQFKKNNLYNTSCAYISKIFDRCKYSQDIRYGNVCGFNLDRIAFYGKTLNHDHSSLCDVLINIGQSVAKRTKCALITTDDFVIWRCCTAHV
jgi:hypothetical protein